MITSRKPIGPGCDEFDQDSLPLEIAIEKMRLAVPSATRIKTVKLRKSLGRVLAQDIKASHNVPNHTNSAMDGYAFAGKALDGQGFASLQVLGTAYAGKPFVGEVKLNQCVKIMTGAIMPANCDTVVMQEYAQIQQQQMSITKAAKLGQHVRLAGEDIRNGDVVLRKGTHIGSAQLGIIASLGQNKIRIYKKPRVAIFSNGDEIKAVGEPLQHGQVYDSNRHTLFAMLTKLGVKVVDLGVIGDNYKALKKIIKRGNKKADMVITSAGASVGEADYVYDVLSETGKVSLWKIAIKPGRPLVFGELSKSVFFGLPGNPVSVMITFALCVKPCLEKLRGQTKVSPMIFQGKTLTDLRKRSGRQEFQRAIVYKDDNGDLVVNARKYQGSGVLSSMTQGNCFIVLGLDNTGVKAGQLVDILPFTEIF